MKKVLVSSCMFMFLTASFASAQTTVFDHGFDNGTSGDLSSGGAAGAPAAGTLTVSGGLISPEFIYNPGLENERIASQAYTTLNNGTFNSIVLETDENGAVIDQTVNDVGTPAGNFLVANLSSPAAVTGTLGAGLATTIDFSLGSFGGSSSTPFKYSHIIGRSSNGLEVFQLLYRASGVVAQREFFARELGQDSTTFTNGFFSGLEGTLVLDSSSNGFNTTRTDRAPSFQLDVNVTFDASGWSVTALPQGGSFGPADPTVTGLGIASGATDLATIEFFTSHNASVDTQNKGLWLDELVVETGVMLGSDVPGDYNNDGQVNAADIDLLSAQLGNPASVNPLMNLDTDDTITLADHDLHITTLVQDDNGTGALIGDLNFDGDVDVSQISIVGGGVVNVGDASVLLANLGTDAGAGYAEGDLNGDGDVDVSQISFVGGSVVNVGDASILLANLGQSTAGAPAASAVPEPGSLSLLAVAAIGLVSRRKRS